MSITEEVSFDKEGNTERFPLLNRLFLALVIILTASLSFGLGRLSVAGDGEPIRLEYDQALVQNSPNIPGAAQTASAIQGAGNAASPTAKAGEVITSSKGTKYHYPHCSGAKQIKADNRIIFPSAAAAEAAGYALAANCKPN
jgi:hypothetical protein